MHHLQTERERERERERGKRGEHHTGNVLHQHELWPAKVDDVGLLRLELSRVQVVDVLHAMVLNIPPPGPPHTHSSWSTRTGAGLDQEEHGLEHQRHGPDSGNCKGRDLDIKRATHRRPHTDTLAICSPCFFSAALLFNPLLFSSWRRPSSLLFLQSQGRPPNPTCSLRFLMLTTRFHAPNPPYLSLPLFLSSRGVSYIP